MSIETDNWDKPRPSLISGAGEIGSDEGTQLGSVSISLHNGEILPKIKKRVNDSYPRMMDEFDTILKDMLDLFSKKQDDYGPNNIGLGKSIVTDPDDIKDSSFGLIIRMNDKIQRLLHLAKNNKEPNNESIDDTLLDIANYCVMLKIVRKGLWGK